MTSMYRRLEGRGSGLKASIGCSWGLGVGKLISALTTGNKPGEVSMTCLGFSISGAGFVKLVGPTDLGLP